MSFATTYGLSTMTTTQSPLAIEADGLVKAFGETRAVDGVDHAVRTGSV
jgi:ABC-2 type transport system ATP-binding protein